MEFFIGMAVGWFLCKALRSSSPSFDRILAWDQNVLAWRVVPQGTRLSKDRRYLAAVEIAETREET